MTERRITKDNTRVIGENQMAFTNPTSKKPIIATYGVFTCMALILRNTETGEIGVCHFVHYSPNIINYMIERMGVDATKLEGKIVGSKKSMASYEESQSHFDNICDQLNANKIKFETELFPEISASFCIDSRDCCLLYTNSDDMEIINELINENVRNRKYPDDDGFPRYIRENGMNFICEFDGRAIENQKGSHTSRLRAASVNER